MPKKGADGKAKFALDPQWDPNRFYFQNTTNGKKKTLGNVITRATMLLIFCNTKMTEKEEMRLIKFPEITDANGNKYGGKAGGMGPGFQMQAKAKADKRLGPTIMISQNFFFESLYGCTTA